MLLIFIINIEKYIFKNCEFLVVCGNWRELKFVNWFVNLMFSFEKNKIYSS